MKIDWDITFKALAIIFTAIGGLYRWRHFRIRAKLKDDLEILKLYSAYGTDNPGFKALKEHIDYRIAVAYPSGEESFQKEKRLALRANTILLVVATIAAFVSILSFFVVGFHWFMLFVLMFALFSLIGSIRERIQ